MPTARELLEQADALMRRNRERQPAPDDDDIPELTEEIELELPETLDVPPVASPALRATATDLDEIPELTDAVEEIEAPSILTVPADEGEPSQWLDVDRGEVSVTGPAPDSIVAVPPAPPRPDAAGPRARRTDAPVPAPSTIVAPSSAVAPASAAALAASFFAGGAPAAAPPAPESTPAAPTPAIAEALPDEAMIVVEIPPVAEPPDEAPIADEVPAPEEPRPVVATPVDAPSPPPVAAERDVAPAVIAAAPPAAAPDAVQWDALAEEIRMQVLQRIDIFTDTGMHEQLAARLQPIVDRASADLVTTINQHVGQLLRAYVAEAIEREIEKWRQGSG